MQRRRWVAALAPNNTGPHEAPTTGFQGAAHQVGQWEQAQSVVMVPIDRGDGDWHGAQMRLVHQSLDKVLAKEGEGAGAPGVAPVQNTKLGRLHWYHLPLSSSY